MKFHTHKIKNSNALLYSLPITIYIKKTKLINAKHANHHHHHTLYLIESCQLNITLYPTTQCTYNLKCKNMYRLAPKSKPLPNYQKIVLNGIKVCQWD